MVYVGSILLIIGIGILFRPAAKQFLKRRQYSVTVKAVCSGQKPYVNYLNLKMNNPVFTYTYEEIGRAHV